MTYRIAFAALPLVLAAPAFAQDDPAPVTPTSVVAEAAPEEWIAIAAEDLLVMELAPDTAGDPRTVVIQLLPPPFSQPWVENIRTLALAHWWDGTSVNRVQDNYVTQWGDVTEEKVLPEGVVAPVVDYETTNGHLTDAIMAMVGPAEVDRLLAQGTDSPEYAVKMGIREDLNADAAAGGAFFSMGWPAASDGRELESQVWPIHCYGYVGVGRGYAPDTGTGAELYTIIGQPQRHMDRNLAVVGRIIEGMEHLSSLPRGSGDLGFYTEEEAHLRTPILTVRLASELEQPPAFEYLDTASESFARYVHVRANRDDAFYTVPAGGVDVCSVQVPVREMMGD
ncbi:peptidylprolyl isomerase [Erythrobacter alti]|uniref:peptidylprolyl isomerase n=1 Tax=Erythrobacter alti TaxID=1896145 RepID=UPI0030F37149